jgi:magnesium chelatase family protein
MLATLPSAALVGVDAYRVDVEVDVAGGLPQYIVVGLPAASVKEGATRIRAALKNCGQDLPTRRITVNLAPADRRKDGAAFDLAIAVGIVLAEAPLCAAVVRDLMLLGELGLDGSLRAVRGVLAAAALAREQDLRGIVVPRCCAAEAAVVQGLQVYAVDHLSQVLAAVEGRQPLPVYVPGARTPPPVVAAGDFCEVRGQAFARRAIEISVAGGHNLLLYGTPGIGKTMLARRIPSIAPPMTIDEQIEVTRIYSAVGLAPPEGLVTQRPFRAPHHSISPGALVGGGAIPHPGEISLAHRGVLFLDELPEFPRTAIEALRQPLEDRQVRLSRVHGNVRIPASFHLVASANPCPCGWHGSEVRTCVCPIATLLRYRSRLSGPILDRIDLQVRVAHVGFDEMRGAADAEPSVSIRARVVAARARQAERLAPYGVLVNAEMDTVAMRATCRLDAAAESLLSDLYEKRRGMTARGLDRLLRVARTIADLEDRPSVDKDSLFEAAALRALDLDPLADPRLPCVIPATGTPAAGVAAAGGEPDAHGEEVRDAT